MPVPRSLSATAMETAILCPSRWVATNFERGSEAKGVPALLGTSLHETLDDVVRSIYVNKDGRYKWTLEDLYASFDMHFARVLKSQVSTELKNDGRAMLKKWFERTDLANVTILSMEEKAFFSVKTSAGEIPFNYIYDRLDAHEFWEDGRHSDCKCETVCPRIIEVVDYKSLRLPVQPSDLEHKFQARVYGLMAQIKYPHAERIFVTFDMLRYDTVSRVFSRAENIVTWKTIKSTAEDLIRIGTHKPHPEVECFTYNAKEEDCKEPDHFYQAEEVINSGCNFCIRKSTCKTLQSNIDVGGIESLTTLEEVVRLRHSVASKLKALRQLQNELDQKILVSAADEEVLEFDFGRVHAKVGVSRRRAVDADRVKNAVGLDIFADYGGVDITLTSLDKLLADKRLTAQQVQEVKGMIKYVTGEPSVKTNDQVI